jgi:hypothetical protein
MLHFELKGNREIIGELELTRIDPTDAPYLISPDTECTYSVLIDTGASIYRNTTKHRFGNGAWSLVHQAIGEYLTEEEC